jgi:peptidyl-prolyl cis-trans isomerase SurA
VALSAKAQRDQLKQLVREQKLEEAYARWLEDVRAGAYVEYRDAPQ